MAGRGSVSSVSKCGLLSGPHHDHEAASAMTFRARIASDQISWIGKDGLAYLKIRKPDRCKNIHNLRDRIECSPFVKSARVFHGFIIPAQTGFPVNKANNKVAFR